MASKTGNGQYLRWYDILQKYFVEFLVSSIRKLENKCDVLAHSHGMSRSQPIYV